MSSIMSIIKRQYLSDLIDLGICLLPSILTIYLTNIRYHFKMIGMFELMALIYLLYGVINLFVNQGKTIGNIILRVNLISTNEKVKSSFKFALRVIMISLILFIIPYSGGSNYIILLMIILYVIPIKFNKDDYFYYSLLNLTIGATFVTVDSKSR